METFQVIIHITTNLNDSLKDSTSEGITYVNLQLQDFFFILQTYISQDSLEKQNQQYIYRYVIGDLLQESAPGILGVGHWYNSQFPRTRNSDVQGEEKMDIPTQEGKECTLPSPFCSIQASVDWMMPHLQW